MFVWIDMYCNVFVCVGKCHILYIVHVEVCSWNVLVYVGVCSWNASASVDKY